MKVVILHDWLTGFRGGERVLEALCEMFPEAPIYTLIHQKGSTSDLIESKKIVTSFLDNIPGIYKNYRKFLPLMPLAAKLLKITHKADLVISSSHCVIKGVKKPKGSIHISYIHSPMRYVYDQFNNYFGNASIPIKIAAYTLRPFLIWWDKKTNKNVDVMIANSKFVAERIEKHYDVSPHIVHPFVDLKDFSEIRKNAPEKENFYLMVTAFSPNKRVDLAIKAFNQNGLNLRVIGGGSLEEESRLKTLAKDNISFLGKLTRKEVVDNYAKAKAFIFPGVEDFGITPLEALASGTPVVAYKKGGILETQNEDTAIFFDNDTPESLNKALQSLSLDNKEKLYSKADQFSKEKFKTMMNSIIKNSINF